MYKILTFACILISSTVCNAQITDSSIALKDNSIFSESNNSNGAGTFLFAGKNGQGNNRRTLLKFSVITFNPDSVKSISLRIHVNQVSNVSVRKIRIHKLLNDWGEGTSSGAGGAGAAPSANDATWNFRFYNTQTWTSAGGDFETIASDSIQVADTGYYTFSSPGLLSDYRSWMNNPSSNFGWILIGDELGVNSAKRIDSKEATISGNQPKIFATYNVSPVPVTLDYFSAKKSREFIKLSWQTSSELNLRLFRIEHSTDGAIFTEIGRKNVSGNSAFLKQYEFDHTALNGKHFYRLAIVDRNGREKFSHIISLYNYEKSFVSVYPNPAGQTIQLLKFDGIIDFEILDMRGTKIRAGLLSGNAINISQLPAGMYILSLNGKSGQSRALFHKK